MKEFTYVITDPQGIHARPAGMLVQEAKKFTSAITMKKNDKTADVKRIFAVMSLAAKKDESILISAEGSDEADAIAALQEFCKNSL